MNLNYINTIVCLLFLIHTIEVKLIFAFTLIRHGAEYPKNDLYDGNQTKDSRGLITPVGLRQHYNLGTYLRQIYSIQEKLISQKYSPKNVQFFSTSYQRTLKSSWAFINGLYPLGNGWNIPEQVPEDKLIPPYKSLFPKTLKENQLGQSFALNEGFTPVPVRSLDSILDYCPNFYNLLSRRQQQISAYIELLQTEQKVQITKLKNIFNLNSSQENIAIMCDLFQTLQSDEYLGRPLPQELTQTDKKNLRYIYQYRNSLLFDGSFAKTLSTPLLRMIRKSLTDALQKTQLKFILTFGHKSNLFPVIVLLNLTNNECLTQKWKGQTITSLNCVTPPEFAANLAFQLYEDDTFQHFVSIKYNGEYVYLCERKQQKCLLEQFVRRLKALENNYQAECGIVDKQTVIVQV